MKREIRLAPRNPLVAAAKFRKAGAHDKSMKARRRAHRMQTLREAGAAAAHRTLDPGQDAFESLASYPIPRDEQGSSQMRLLWR